MNVLTSCILSMHVGAWRVCRAFSSVQKKWKEGLKVLGMYLAMAVAKAVQEGNSEVFVTFLIEPPLCMPKQEHSLAKQTTSGSEVDYANHTLPT